MRAQKIQNHFQISPCQYSGCARQAGVLGDITGQEAEAAVKSQLNPRSYQAQLGGFKARKKDYLAPIITKLACIEPSSQMQSTRPLPGLLLRNLI